MVILESLASNIEAGFDPYSTVSTTWPLKLEILRGESGEFLEIRADGTCLISKASLMKTVG